MVMDVLDDRCVRSWVLAVRASWGARAATQLADAIDFAGRSRPDPERLGHALGTQGTPLAEAHDWLAQIPGGRSGRHLRRALHSPEALVRFTAGWADAAADRSDQHQPVSVDLLRLRLHDHVRRAAAQGLGPDVALVVARPTRPHTGDATVRLAEAAAAVFAAGEPIARGSNGSVFVLARRDDALAGCLDDLARIAAVDPVLTAAGVHLWVEPVGQSAALLDALLVDLSA